jgi:hypothetical protein
LLRRASIQALLAKWFSTSMTFIRAIPPEVDGYK